MGKSLLEGIRSPKDIKKMDHRELELLCAEIRAFLIQKVSSTGGHLSSNLGMIETTVALHHAFDSPQDMLVFDVGHQCYTHKLLTGRQKDFDKLRMENGLSGFPRPAESEHDIFTTGHGSTALSVAVGLARAKQLKGERGKVIAIIGDGAFTGGMVYEALNNISGLNNLVVVLNDNKMSISKNDGAMGHYLTRLRTSPGYYKAKSDVKNVLDNTPVIGSGMKKGIQSMKSALRRNLYHSTFFEDMGFQYAGPSDGHNIADLCSLFHWVRNTADAPVFVHLETTKGKGFRPAERNPGAFHGVSTFNVRHIPDPDMSPSDSFSTAFGRELCQLATADERICAITAAMKYGTGLQYFKKNHASRFFDVGMAEEHAVTFAAGLAKGGFVPVACIYSTFLQRSYDQIIHDVMLQKLNVLFAIDRAGLVPGDGETHQGIYDAAFLSQHRDMPIVSPSNYAELRYWLGQLVAEYSEPRAIRYPRGEEGNLLAQKDCSGQKYDQLVDNQGAKAAIITYGTETEEALAAAELLKENTIDADLYQMVWINPIPQDLVAALSQYDTLLFVEEGISQGGIGEHMAMQLINRGFRGTYHHIGVPSTGIGHATVPQLKHTHGLDAQGICTALTSLIQGKPDEG